jgi:hypothetical protein
VTASGTDSRVYEDGSEAFIGFEAGVKEKSGFRAGWVGAVLLKHLAMTGVREFNLTITAREIGVDVRRLYQTVVYFIRRHIMARVRRGWYRLLVDPWELLENIVVQGPNSSKAGSVKESHGTRSRGRVATGVFGVGGLFFDNVRGVTFAGSYVAGDRGRVLGRGDLGGFARVSYAEVGVATGTRLFEGLGSLVVYFKCKWYGREYICSDWVEWRPPSGFYRRRSVVEAVKVYRSRVLPYVFGLVGRAGVVAGAPLERFKSALHGLARRVYLALRPRSSGSGGCRAPAVEVNGDGSYSVCFRCPPVLYRRLMNASRVSGHSWESIIVEVLSGTLP